MFKTMCWTNYYTIRYRRNNYKSNGRKFQHAEPCMQEYLFWHFSSPGHIRFLNDVSVTFIDKTEPSDPLKSERFWPETLMAIDHY